MTTIRLPLRRLPFVRLVQQWLSESPRLIDAFGFTAYYNCRSSKRHAGFLRFSKWVLEVDLEPGAEAILAACGESARYKIRRAPREGVHSGVETDCETFTIFYNAFAETKELETLSSNLIRHYWPNITVTKAVHDGENLAMHAYLLDYASSRATLLYSCSHYRIMNDSKQRNFLARANRFLYWDDMRRFEARGLRWYDFGYFGDTAQIGQVNEFKKGYPCLEKPVSTYISLPLYILRRLTQPRQSF
jgi:hypothetical protein